MDSKLATGLTIGFLMVLSLTSSVRLALPGLVFLSQLQSEMELVREFGSSHLLAVVRPLACLRTTLLEILPPTNADNADAYCWGPLGNRAQVFSIKKTWELIRQTAPPIYWEKSVWFKHAVPKHAFNFWVTTLNRLPVRDIKDQS